MDVRVHGHHELGRRDWPEAEIDAEIARLAPVAALGGFIPLVDHGVPDDVPYENYLFYLETVREVVRHRGAAVMLPLLDTGEIVFVRQYRYPMGEMLLELPAGTIDLDIRQPNKKKVLLDIPPLDLEAGKVYSVFAVTGPEGVTVIANVDAE